MATQLYLSGVSAISGGILDLNGANIELLPGWRPRVAKRRRGVLGGKRYEDVVESIPLRVFGANEAGCVQFLELMAAAMDQARDWKDGSAVDAVILNYAINGTELANPLQTAVLGTPMDAADILELPVTFNSYLQQFEVNPVTLPLERRGEWLGDEETESTNDLTEITAVKSVTFDDDVHIPAPVLASIRAQRAAGSVSNIASPLPDNFTLFWDRDNAISIIDAEDFDAVSGGLFSSVNESANNAQNTNVLRYTAGGITEQSTGSLDVDSDLDDDIRHVGFFASVRNNSATATFRLRGYLTGNLTTTVGKKSEGVYIEPSTGPTWVYLGSVIAERRIASCGLSITSTESSATLDIDTLVVVALNFGNVSIISRTSAAYSTNLALYFVHNHRMLTHPTPLAEVDPGSLGTGPTAIQPYSGVPVIRQSGDKLHSLLLACKGTSWRWLDGNGAVIRADLFATRRPAYLVPR